MGVYQAGGVYQYIKEDNARVLTIAIFPFIDKHLCFQILSVLRSVAILGLK